MRYFGDVEEPGMVDPLPDAVTNAFVTPRATRRSRRYVATALARSSLKVKFADQSASLSSSALESLSPYPMRTIFVSRLDLAGRASAEIWLSSADVSVEDFTPKELIVLVLLTGGKTISFFHCA